MRLMRRPIRPSWTPFQASLRRDSDICAAIPGWPVCPCCRTLWRTVAYGDEVVGRVLAALYDWMISSSEDACLREWRHELLAELTGDVLEVGAGTGLNVAHYPSTVERLVLTEPDRFMRAKLHERIDGDPPTVGSVEVLDTGADRLSFADNSFDAVVSTLVLCSVPDPDHALAEVRRVLKPGRPLVFLEHVAAPEKPRRHAWQRRVEPVWKMLFGGCHLARQTVEVMEKAGFRVDHHRESIRKAFPLVRTSERGAATKPP
jgi:ubiquinone/menaquinone biosynthesis C-methylase UbiE